MNDADVLNQYYTDSVAFYTQNPPSTPAKPETEAKKDFDAYLLQELIRNTAINQRTSRIKTALLFQSHKFMIYTIISLSLLIIPFGIDFGHNKGREKVQKIKIDQELPIDLTIKYQKIQLYVYILNHEAMSKQNTIKPTPPPSLIITEGSTKTGQATAVITQVNK